MNANENTTFYTLDYNVAWANYFAAVSQYNAAVKAFCEETSGAYDAACKALHRAAAELKRQREAAGD
jgi:hypothetical protein